MGKTINNRTLLASKLLEIPSPILLCVHRSDYENAVLDAGSHIVSLNLPLANELVGKSEDGKFANITETVLKLMPNNAPVFLTDYEMLFDPRYELDVIKLFCEISRYEKLVVKWCGKYDDGFLTYAEQGFDDYKKYKISEYEIACVI